MGAAELRPCLGQSGVGTRRSYKWTGIVPPVTGNSSCCCMCHLFPALPHDWGQEWTTRPAGLGLCYGEKQGGGLVHRQNLPRWVSLTVHSAQSSSPIMKSSAMTYELFFFFKDLILFIFGCVGSLLLRAGFL